MGNSTKRSDGRLVRAITDSNGNRKYFYGKTEREINKKILSYQEKEKFGKTFSEVADEWWEQHETTLQPRTAKMYYSIMKFFKNEFKNTYISEIKSKDITYILQIMANQEYTTKTIRNYKIVANLIFEYSVFNNYIEQNSCLSAKVPKGKPSTKRTSVTLEDEQIIINNIDIWLFPYFALMTGMRKGEILALQWQDIDFKNDIISVTKSVTHIGNKPQIKEPKTESGKRIVPLLNGLKNHLKKPKNAKSTDYIFSIDGKTPLRKDVYQRKMNSFQKQTGLNATAHQLRHSFATNAFESGLDAKSLQEIIGHKQISTTMNIYTDFRKKSFENAKSLLNNTTKKQ